MQGISLSASQRWTLCLLTVSLVACGVKAEPKAHTREDDATLVVYSYRHAEPEALNNLQYFVSTVVKPHDPARYIILVDHAMQQHGHMSSQGLPKLAGNAEYLTIRDCFELGHVGKVLLGGKSPVHVSMKQYKFFVWLDSSAKGALLPSHNMQGDRAAPWHTLLTSRITTTTKLVGANIVCQPVREVQLIYLAAAAQFRADAYRRCAVSFHHAAVQWSTLLYTWDSCSLCMSIVIGLSTT